MLLCNAAQCRPGNPVQSAFQAVPVYSRLLCLRLQSRLWPPSPAGQTRTSPFRGFRMRSQDPSQKIRYLARFHQGQSPDAGLDADRRVLYPLEIRAAHRRHTDRKFPFPSFHRIFVIFSRSLIKFALRFRGGLFFRSALRARCLLNHIQGSSRFARCAPCITVVCKKASGSRSVSILHTNARLESRLGCASQHLKALASSLHRLEDQILNFKLPCGCGGEYRCTRTPRNHYTHV